MSEQQPLPEYTGNEFVLVLRDSADGKAVEAAALCRPSQPQPCPSHLVGSYIAENFEAIVEAAQIKVTRGPASAANDSVTVLGPERNRTIVLPERS